MDITIKALSPALIDDYIDYFDTVAFTDNDEWAGCYCLFYHTDPKAQEDLEAWDLATRKALAEKAIRDGVLTGYLAYDGNKVVGWVNAGEKRSFSRLRSNEDLWRDGADIKIKAVVCFLIAPDMRGKGIAKALLQRVADDAAAQGYAFVEGYPQNGTLDQFKHYHGHPAMYEKAGFETVRKFEGFSIVRKKLK